MTRATASSLAALALLAIAAPAHAAGGLQMAPTRIEAQVVKGDELPRVRLRNASRAPMAIRLDALRSGQDVSGLPDAVHSPQAIREGRGFLRLRPRRIVLKPGQGTAVRATVTGGPTAGVGSYGVIMATAAPADAQSRSGAVLQSSIRLSANVLLRYPGRARSNGSADSLRAEQGGKRVLRLVARISNRGNLHGKPRGKLAVFDDRGRVVLRRLIGPGVVLPGASRDFPVDIRKVLPAGSYEARLITKLGDGHNTLRIPFDLVGPNLLPTAKLRITRLDPPKTEAGEDYTVLVGLANDGTAPIEPTGRLIVAGQPARALAPGRLDPGREAAWRDELPGVPEGTHELHVAFMDGDRVLAERTVVFTTGATVPVMDRVMDWLASHVPLLVLGFGCLLGAGAALALARIRRLQRRLRELQA